MSLPKTESAQLREPASPGVATIDQADLSKTFVFFSEPPSFVP